MYFRWELSEDGDGDAGRAGLVSRPAGNHPDTPLRQWYGFQQGM